MGALRLEHVPEGAADLGAAKQLGKSISQTERPGSVTRIITRSEREQRRAIFCEVLATRRGVAAEVARAWGVTDPVVQKVRRGTAALSDEKLLALPAWMRAFFDEQLAEPVQLRLEGL